MRVITIWAGHKMRGKKNHNFDYNLMICIALPITVDIICCYYQKSWVVVIAFWEKLLCTNLRTIIHLSSGKCGWLAKTGKISSNKNLQEWIFKDQRSVRSRKLYTGLESQSNLSIIRPPKGLSRQVLNTHFSLEGYKTHGRYRQVACCTCIYHSFAVLQN